MVKLVNSCAFFVRRKLGGALSVRMGRAGETGSGLPRAHEPCGLWQIQGYLKHLKAIVQYKEEIRTRLQNLYSVRATGRAGWGAAAGAEVLDSRAPPHITVSPPPAASPQWRGFLDLADGISEDTLDRVIDSQKPNQCCTLVYSLSVTGPPKAMMLSHDNVSVPWGGRLGLRGSRGRRRAPGGGEGNGPRVTAQVPPRSPGPRWPPPRACLTSAPRRSRRSW